MCTDKMKHLQLPIVHLLWPNSTKNYCTPDCDNGWPVHSDLWTAHTQCQSQSNILLVNGWHLCNIQLYCPLTHQIILIIHLPHTNVWESMEKPCTCMQLHFCATSHARFCISTTSHMKICISTINQTRICIRYCKSFALCLYQYYKSHENLYK